jgi:membrane protein implicated in regulation of membrane protease activity
MNLVPIVWLVVGILLIVAEFFSPTFALVFSGIAAVITGLTTFAGLTGSLGAQLGLFALLSVVLLLALRRAAKRVFKGHTSDIANAEPGFDEFIGRDATVVTFDPTTHTGRISFRGADWSAESADSLAAGELVRITARRGSTLTVQKRSA